MLDVRSQPFGHTGMKIFQGGELGRTDKRLIAKV